MKGANGLRRSPSESDLGQAPWARGHYAGGRPGAGERGPGLRAELAEMVEMHSSTGFYAVDDSLDDGVLYVDEEMNVNSE